MKCMQLGGACDKVFSGETFEEIATQSQNHGREMMAINDAPHLAAMNEMMEIMNSGSFDSWMAARKAEFEAS